MGFSAKEGQELEVLELDPTGEFFRVRALGAERYRGSDSVSVAEGWLRKCYLEWSGVAADPTTATTYTIRYWIQRRNIAEALTRAEQDSGDVVSASSGLYSDGSGEAQGEDEPE